MLKINLEEWKDCKDDIASLIEAHWKEVAWYQDKMQLEPKWDMYEVMDHSGTLYPFVVRTEEGRIAGYAIFFVTEGLHYSNNLLAENDIMYIVPDFRQQNVAVELINYAKVSLQIEGVSVMSIKMKTDHPFHSVMDATQFDMMEYNYTKWIGG